MATAAKKKTTKSKNPKRIEKRDVVRKFAFKLN